MVIIIETKELEWLGQYRDFVGTIYRSANAYSQLCKKETLGDQVNFSPYEVQIMEIIMENKGNYRNMKWYANQLGLSQSAYTKYVKKMVDKGLLDKYHVKGNKKDIIVQVSELGHKEYKKYSEHALTKWFSVLFDKLNGMTEKEIQDARDIISIWGSWHTELVKIENAELLKIEQNS